MSRIFSDDDSINPRQGGDRWTQDVNIPYRSIYTEHLAGKVRFDSFITGLRPIEIVSVLPTLPDSSYPEGSVVFLSTDGKLYRNVSNSWTAEVPTTDLTGTITETQIADDAISTPKLQANAITTAKLAAGAVTATEIASNAVTADKILAGAVTAAKISVSQLDAVAAAMGTLISGQIWNAASNPTKAVAFSGTIPATADSFIDFTAGTGASEVFLQVNNERLRIFGDGSLTTHGILKGYALYTESGEGGPGGVLYATGATVLGNNAYLQSHKQGSTTILGSADEDMLEIDSGSLSLRGKAATWGLSLMAVLGDYSVSTGGFTEVTDTWAAADDPDGTADGKNVLTLTTNGTQTVTAANRLAIPLVLTGGKAYDGKYTLKFKILHDCTNYTEPGLFIPDGDTLVSTLTIEANVNGTGYTDVGQVVSEDLTDGTTSEKEFTKTVDIGNTNPTSVTFRLKLSTTMQIDPENLSGDIVTHVRVYITTGIGTDPYDVSWQKTTGSVQNRRGVQLFGVDAGATIVPHINLDKESFSASPADGDGVEGDVIYVSGAVKKLQYHDGSSWNTLESFSGNADTLDSLDSSQFLRADISDTYGGALLTFNGGGQSEKIRLKADDNAQDPWITSYNELGTRMWIINMGDRSYADGFRIYSQVAGDYVFTITTGGNVLVGSSPTVNTGRELQIIGAAAGWSVDENDGPVDEKVYDFRNSGGQLRFRAVNDANTAATEWLLVNRTGTTIDSIALPNGDLIVGSDPGGTQGLRVSNGATISGEFISKHSVGGNSHFGRSDATYISFPSAGKIVLRSYNGSTYTTEAELSTSLLSLLAGNNLQLSDGSITVLRGADGSVDSSPLSVGNVGSPASGNPRYYFSIRSDNSLWIYGYDGTTFKNLIGFNYGSHYVEILADIFRTNDVRSKGAGSDLTLRRDTSARLTLKSSEITAHVALIPSADSSLDLGSNSKAWRTLYIDTIDAVDTAGVAIATHLKIGTSTTDKWGFANTTPVARASVSFPGTSIGSTLSTSLAAVSGTGDDTQVNDNFTLLYEWIERIHDRLLAHGFITEAAL